MVFFNYALRKLNAKIVYYGPGLCGKTTNLQWIHDHFEGGQRGKMISLATEGDRTIFFDLLPIDIGSIRGMDVTLQLYTVPGQVHYNSTRQLVLRGADGVVFVADSQRTMKSSNVESYENLQENLMLQGIEIKGFPHALQFNKRDLRDLLSMEDLDESLNVFSVPFFEAVATEGIGVQETLEGIVKLVMRNLREKYEPVASASGPRAPQPMGAAGPTAFGAPPAQPAAEPPAPVAAPDFAALKEPPAAAPAPTPPAPVVSDEIQTPAPDPAVATAKDVDEIPTAVYDGADAETPAPEPTFDGPDFGDKSPVFADVDTAVSAFEPDESEEPGELFAGAGDEAATDEDDAAATTPETSGDDWAPEVEIVDENLQPAIPEESMEDLFETEVPTVKAFVAKAMGFPEPTGVSVGDAGDEPAAQLEDPPEVAAAPPVADRYEDRIQAPGPFAPATTAEEPAAPIAKSAADEEAVRAEVRQALGASEDREALASLSGTEEAKPEQFDEVPDEPAEVQPVVPPPPEEPAVAETTTVDEETSPPVFVADEPAADLEPEKAAEVEEPAVEPAPADTPFEVAAVAEPVTAEPEDDEVNFEMVATDETPEEEPVADEPAADEPVFEEPAVSEPVMPAPPVADDPLEKSQPIIFGSGEPFADDEVATVVAEVLPQEDSPADPTAGAIAVTAQDNQLHLALRGSGAIAEMGQVRALDLEVPVPGEWVGNRKVTLQLRLTLTPAEDEDE